MFIYKNTNNASINYFSKVFFKTILTFTSNKKMVIKLANK